MIIDWGLGEVPPPLRCAEASEVLSACPAPQSDLKAVNAIPKTSRAGFLIIGYGNTLRSDDGVGPRVAAAVEALGLPGVRTLVCQQLSPEHAAPIAEAEAVIFVDAAVDAPREVQLRPLEPNETSQLMAHAADPRTMLALSRDVFGHAPRAWWLTIPAVSLEFSERLTAEAEQGCAEAIKRIRSLCGSN